MKLIRKRYDFSFNQVVLLKLAVASIAIAIGAYWSVFFAQYIWWLVGLGVIIGLYLASAISK